MLLQVRQKFTMKRFLQLIILKINYYYSHLKIKYYRIICNTEIIKKIENKKIILISIQRDNYYFSE